MEPRARLDRATRPLLICPGAGAAAPAAPSSPAPARAAPWPAPAAPSPARAAPWPAPVAPSPARAAPSPARAARRPPAARAAPATATIYYARDCATGADKDCGAGNDSNVGTSASAPWRSFERARSQFSSLRAGDRIQFCKGGRFTAAAGGSQWVNATCTAANPCVVASYKAPWASGDEGRPFIHFPAGQNAIDFSDSGNAAFVVGFVFAGLVLVCVLLGVGYFVYNDVDNVTICDSNIPAFGIGVQSAGTHTPNPGADSVNANLMVS